MNTPCTHTHTHTSIGKRANIFFERFINCDKFHFPWLPHFNNTTFFSLEVRGHRAFIAVVLLLLLLLLFFLYYYCVHSHIIHYADSFMPFAVCSRSFRHCLLCILFLPFFYLPYLHSLFAIFFFIRICLSTFLHQRILHSDYDNATKNQNWPYWK